MEKPFEQLRLQADMAKHRLDNVRVDADDLADSVYRLKDAAVDLAKVVEALLETLEAEWKKIEGRSSDN